MTTTTNRIARRFASAAAATAVAATALVAPGLLAAAPAHAATTTAALIPIGPISPIVIGGSIRTGYRVDVLSFKAINESGTDWLGSDEPYLVANSTSGGAMFSTRSQVFGDVDTGESRTVNLCVVSNCTSGVAGPLGVNIVMMEHDLGNPADIQKKVTTGLNAIHWLASLFGQSWPSSIDSKIVSYLTGWLADDVLGAETRSYSQAELSARMPTNGASFVDTYRFGGPGQDAYYTAQVRITRIDTFVPPVAIG